MAKSVERLQARELRKKGESIREIAKKLYVSRSSASLWCHDIILTEEQTKSLFQRDLVGAESGRIKAAEWHRNERQIRVNLETEKAGHMVGSISNRELFLLGLALYWAEGSKTGRRVIFVNSDPAMISLFIRWVRECFAIPLADLSCRVQINEAHTHRLQEIEHYWSQLTGLPLSQFTKTTLIHVKAQKVYESVYLYHGVLAVKVRRGTNMSYLVDGGIQHLRELARLMVQ